MLNACIIDDEANSREVLELLLKESHPDVRIAGTASNITDALEMIKLIQPDLLFQDYIFFKHSYLFIKTHLSL